MKRIPLVSALLTITVPRLATPGAESGFATPRAQGVSAEAFGAGFGQGVEHTGRQADQFYQKERDEQDATRANTATADYETWKVKHLYDDQAGLLTTTQGENAIGIEGKALETRTKFIADYEKNLATDRQKEIFRAYVAKDEPQYLATINNHEHKEGQKLKTTQAAAAVGSIQQNIAKLVRAPGDINAAFDGQVKILMDKVTIQAAFAGHGPESEVTKAAKAEALSQVTALRVKSLLDQDRDDEALDYFTAQSDSLNEKERGALAPVIEKVKETATGRKLADGLAVKPDDINTPFDAETLKAKIDAGKESEEVKEIARKRIDEHARAYNQQKKGGEESASNRIYGMAIDGGKGYTEIVKAIKTAPELDYGKKNSLLSWADTHFHISEDRAEAKAEAREAKQAAKRTMELEQLGKFLQFQSEYVAGQHGNLTPKQVATKAAEFGGYVDNAMQFVQNVNDNLQQVKIDQSEFLDTVRLLRQNEAYAKLLPATDNPKDTDKAKMALLQGKVFELMSLSRKADPRKSLSVQGAILQAMQDVTIKEKWSFLGMSGGGATAPLYTLQSEISDKYGKDAAKWPKASQDQVIDTIWKARNPNKVMTPAQREAFRAELLKG